MISNIFRKKEWIENHIENIEASIHGVTVTIVKMPCRSDKISGEIRYLYPNYGYELATSVTNKIESFFTKLQGNREIRFKDELSVPETEIVIKLDRSIGGHQGVKLLGTRSTRRSN